MRIQIRYIGLLAGVVLISSACAGAASPGEQITGEEVVRTAEAIAAATLNAATSTPTKAPATATETPVPVTDTPAPTDTPEIPKAVANYNANVRSGPGEEYDVVDFFLAGQEAWITGQYLDEESMSWLYLERIDEGINGWVFFGAATIYGNIDAVPFLVVEEGSE